MPETYKHDLPKPGAVNYRALLLYALPAPLIVKLLISIVALQPMKIVLSGFALLFFYSAAQLTRITLARYAEAAKRPTPQKVRDYRKIALVYIGVGVLILMFLIKRSPLALFIMPVCGMLGYYLTYGIDSRQFSPAIDLSAMPKATREAIQGAYSDLEAIETLSQQLNDDDLRPRVDKVVTQSYKILGLLSRSPNDAGRARRFLNVYVHRIKEILSQYVNLAAYDKAQSYRQRLADVLDETYKAFSEQEAKLLDDDKLTLDVQLEVLDEQIKNEQKP